MPVKMLHQRRNVTNGSKKLGKSGSKGRASGSNTTEAQSSGETVLLVMNPSKRDRYWEHRNEKMSRQITDMNREVERYKNRLDELQTIHAQAAPQEQLKVQREIEETQRAIRSSRATSILLRNHFQVTDDKEPGEIAAQFRSINRDIDNLCRDINEDLARLCAPGTDVAITTSLDVRDMVGVERALYGDFGAQPSLIESSSGTGRPISEFMDFALQFLINKELHRFIFQPFNPLMTASDNECISRSYEEVRRREPQVISGRWRSSTFAARQSSFSQTTVQRWLDSLHTGLLSRVLLPFLVAVYGDAAYISSKREQSLASIISNAYQWNRMVKTEVILLDFQPVMFPTSTPFDPSAMSPINQTPPRLDAEPILSTVSLGLQSSEGEGGGVSPKHVWQQKVVVLTDAYFES